MRSETILFSPLLESLPWIDHGFGTRHAPLSQDGMASLKQVHSSVVLTAQQVAGCVGEGDALITNLEGVSVSVRTADCYPILLADIRRRTVAAVHAGWRGTAGGVVVQTLDKMAAGFGADPRDIYAAIGPGIGKCCYEVGAEVGIRFGLDGAGHLDLAAANRSQLVDAGVPENQIEIIGGCTRCNEALFYSYRRDSSEVGRMISYIRLI